MSPKFAKKASWRATGYLTLGVQVGTLAGCERSSLQEKADARPEAPSVPQRRSEPDPRARAPRTQEFDPVASLQGEWAVVGDHCPHICALSDAETRAWRGTRLHIGVGVVRWRFATCDEAQFSSQPVSWADFYKAYHFMPDALGLAPGELHLVEVRCRARSWVEPGSSFIVTPEARFTFWDGVVFRLDRPDRP